jgi:hypothetical protein
MEGYVKSDQLPPHQRQETIKAIDAKLKSTSQIHILLRTFTPSISRINSIELRNITQLRTNLVALAIERYRLANDKLPDRLSELFPAYLESVPKDPFDGNEIRYRKLETGFVVYSIGEDLSDDGGKEEPPWNKRESKNWDVTFIVER